jgi:hypothetical protein
VPSFFVPNFNLTAPLQLFRPLFFFFTTSQTPPSLTLRSTTVPSHCDFSALLRPVGASANMALKTITKTNPKVENAVTATGTEIDQQQSLQLLQTMIHGSVRIASLASYPILTVCLAELIVLRTVSPMPVLHAKAGPDYYRNFFPEYVFDEQIYQWSEKIHSYGDYAAGRIHQDRQVAKSDTAIIHVLRRNRSKRVDKFLDCLVSQDGSLSVLG